MKLFVSVTQEDIDKALKAIASIDSDKDAVAYSESCPIAKSIRRQGYLSRIMNTCAIVYFRTLPTACFVLPDSARKFIRDFDDTGRANPIEFEMETYNG